MYDTGLVIGRFQPLHKGHVKVIRKALDISKHAHVVVGHNGFKDLKHFLDVEVVVDLIRQVFQKEISEKKLTISILNDMDSDKLWVCEVTKTLKNIRKEYGIGDDDVIVGGTKEADWYNQLFPKLDFLIMNYNGINTKDLRKNIFCKIMGMPNSTSQLPEEVQAFMHRYETTEEFKDMQDRYTKFYHLQSILG